LTDSDCALATAAGADRFILAGRLRCFLRCRQASGQSSTNCSRHSAPAAVASAQSESVKLPSPAERAELLAALQRNRPRCRACHPLPKRLSQKNWPRNRPPQSPVALPPKKMEDENPYVVPDRKPFISRETFITPPKRQRRKSRL